jgi:DNA polymerase-1
MSRMSELLSEMYNEQKTIDESLGRDGNVLIIDGMNMFLRAFSASPAINHRGEHVGGLVGFLKSLFFVIRKFRPTRCVLVFDGKDAGRRRRKKFPMYKSGRRNKDRLNRFVGLEGVMDDGESFSTQLKNLDLLLSELPVTMICIDYVEADDVIGHLVNQYYGNTNTNIVIVSTDQDFLQLVNNKTRLYSPIKKKLFNVETVINEFGITPNNYLTFRTLTGDLSDNIPGVKGLGLKTFIKYYPEATQGYLDVDDIMNISNKRIDEGSKRKTYKNVLLNESQVRLNWQLMQLDDVDISGHSKQLINRIMDSPIYKFNDRRFRDLIYGDGLDKFLSNFNSWINSSLTQLNSYAETE